MKGIDVSQHNGKINWDKVKGQIDFAILRLGWIGNKNNHTLDTEFERNYSECKRVGIPVGVYVFNYAQSEENARSGAEWTLNHLNGKSLDLPVYIDMENDDNSSYKLSSLGKRKLTDIAKAFNEVIEKSGKWAGVYANLDWWNNYLIKDELYPRYTSWVAHYKVAEDKYKGEYDMLQYTDKGKIISINGNVDLNNMYRDLISEIKGSTPAPVPTKSIDELAQEVINGNWGNGDDRRRRLVNAGYNYNEVQKRVNEILGVNKINYYPACNPRYTSIVDALNSIGVNSSYTNRKAIAIKNGISNYIGSSHQNVLLLNKLKAGNLIK